jgi:DNA-binding NtrC family response regulator
MARTIVYNGLVPQFVSENQHKEIIILDEIDKMPIKGQEGLLAMMERGSFTSTKVRNTRTVKADMVIFATSNKNTMIMINTEQYTK